MKKVYVIGISGGSASGKSTFVDYLEKRLTDLKVKVFHMDEYYKAETKRPIISGILNGKNYIDDNHPLSLDLDKFHLDIEEAILEDWDVILVEGIFALWDQKIIPLLDLKLYVDCDSDERIIRRIKRHLEFGQNLDEITERYVQAVQPRHMEYVEPNKWKADIILNGFQMSPLAYEMIITWIYKMVSERDN